MSTLRLLPRFAAVKGGIRSRISPRLVHSSSLGLSLRRNAPGLWTASQHFHKTAIRGVSQAAKDKVIERKEAFKSESTIETRVKRIVIEQLGVKQEEVCSRTLLY